MPAQAAKLQSGAVAVLRDHGFDDAELAASWQGQKRTSPCGITASGW
jgi:hypothetical protein